MHRAQTAASINAVIQGTRIDADLLNIIHKVNQHKRMCIYMHTMNTYCLFQSTEAFPVDFLDQLSPQTQSMGCHSQQAPVSAVQTKITTILPVNVTRFQPMTPNKISQAAMQCELQNSIICHFCVTIKLS